MRIPESILRLIDGKEYTVDKVGCSGATVHIYDDVVLKVEKAGGDWGRNLAMLAWLGGKIPVPQIIESEVVDGIGYLLMTRIRGRMLSSSTLLFEPYKLADLLVDVLHRFWELDYSECPSIYNLDMRLQACGHNVFSGLIWNDSSWPRQYNGIDFRHPADLLRWLTDNKPAEDFVVVHGDMYLTNILGVDGKLSGLIDFSWGGVADRYQDLALCLRGLRNSLKMVHNPDTVSAVLDYMVSRLDISLDIDKLWYYIMLDELV